MQKGSKSGGGQGLPDRAAEEQATTRGDRGFERVSRAEILYVHCLRFLSGLFYIVSSERSRPSKGSASGICEKKGTKGVNKGEKERKLEIN